MKIRFHALLLISLVSFPDFVWAWGNLGHESVGLVAEKILSRKAKEKVEEILGGQSLPQASTWADVVRRQEEWKHTAWYHFTKVPDDASYKKYLESLKGQAERAKGDVVLALVKAEKVLLSRTEEPDAKKAALAFLIHFVGDAHQPFHSGRDEDRGGNQISVNWMGSDSNLHSVWDSGIIRSSYPALEGMPPMEQAKFFVDAIDQVSPSQRRDWMRGYFDTWTEESVLARIRPYVGYADDQEYYRRIYIEVVNRRVLQAGYRLGALLNTYFDPTSANVIPGWSSQSRRFDTMAKAALGDDYLDRILLQQISKAKSEFQANISLVVDFPPDCPHEYEVTDLMEIR